MNMSATWCARSAIAGSILFFVVVYILFLIIQPELNPLHRFGSEYAVGRMGWLMKAAFFCWGFSLLALAFAMSTGLDSEVKSRAAIVLFAVAATGIFLSGIFDSDLQVRNENPPPLWIEPPPSDDQIWHAVSGIVGLSSLMIGAGLVSRRLRVAGRLHGRYRWLQPLSWLSPIAFVGFATVFVPYGLAGLGQRLFLLFLLLWVILAAHGLGKAAFASGTSSVSQSRDSDL